MYLSAVVNFGPDRAAEYCNEWLYVRLLASHTLPNFHKIFYIILLPLAVSLLSSDNNTILYVLLVLWMTQGLPSF